MIRISGIKAIFVGVTLGITTIGSATIGGSAIAGEADVTAVNVRSGSTYSFSVTVRHADEGWDHYADRWEVLSLDGKVLATRVLAHPHVNEQPFTRSLSGVKLPAGTKEVRLRAHDSVHKYGGTELILNLETGETRPVPGGDS